MTHRTHVRCIEAALATALVLAPAAAQTGAGNTAAKSLATSWGIFVYPAQNQTKEQQDKDEYECYQWAKQQTAIDPLAPPPAAAAPPAPNAKGGEPPPADGTALKGAARGAAAGAVVGEAAHDDAGDGARRGAVVGAIRAKRAKAARVQAHEQAEAKAKAVDEERKGTFRKAFSVCLEGRRYTVK
ncbi:MAG TPA: hypothetical protein VJS92_08100 [Candidatus Polarisedimenticolaceae bacterium]|nr:hypothetical protein [Candidatus Polarisedimenticolaceae bacterium]